MRNRDLVCESTSMPPTRPAGNVKRVVAAVSSPSSAQTPRLLNNRCIRNYQRSSKMASTAAMLVPVASTFRSNNNNSNDHWTPKICEMDRRPSIGNLSDYSACTSDYEETDDDLVDFSNNGSGGGGGGKSGSPASTTSSNTVRPCAAHPKRRQNATARSIDMSRFGDDDDDNQVNEDDCDCVVESLVESSSPSNVASFSMIGLQASCNGSNSAQIHRWLDSPSKINSYARNNNNNKKQVPPTTNNNNNSRNSSNNNQTK